MNTKLIFSSSNANNLNYLALLKGFFTWNAKESLSRKNFWLALGCNFLLWFSLSIIILISGLNVGLFSISIQPAFGIGAAFVSLFFFIFFIYLAARRLKDLSADEGKLAFLFKPKTFYIFMFLYVLIFAGFLYLWVQTRIADIEFLIRALLIGEHDFDSYLFCLALASLTLFSFIFNFYLFIFLFDKNASLLSKKPLGFKFDVFSTCFFALALALIVYFFHYDFKSSFDNTQLVEENSYTFLKLCLVVAFIVIFFYLPNFITRLFASFVLGLYCISFIVILLTQTTKDLDTFFEISLMNATLIFILGLFFWALNYKNAAILMLVFLFYSSFRIEDDKTGLLLDIGFTLGLLFAVFAGLSFWKKFNDFDKNKAYIPSLVLIFIALIMLDFLSKHYFLPRFSSLEYSVLGQLKALAADVINHAYTAFYIYVFYYFTHKNLANKALKLSILGLIALNLLFMIFVVSVRTKILSDILSDSVSMSLAFSFYFCMIYALFAILLALALKKEHKLFALVFGVRALVSMIQAFFNLSQANAGEFNSSLIALEYIIHFIFYHCSELCSL
ncbi:hypothetical protein CQA38_04115 [Campylobacter sp. MIT 12-5580]|uniref:hypothetical protein n=1 Tax=Campylobacter sp. MIT 12-5580 TaxID=2040651 RepID=UPI0010F8D83F|nr:hypothetical protein [Campylobacter sp. MIT 12-5580]TKX29272.1 hypothetical protein CQA38_04115 [Campylobacter sp. MIT 12-5580]